MKRFIVWALVVKREKVTVEAPSSDHAAEDGWAYLKANHPEADVVDIINVTEEGSFD